MKWWQVFLSLLVFSLLWAGCGWLLDREFRDFGIAFIAGFVLALVVFVLGLGLGAFIVDARQERYRKLARRMTVDTNAATLANVQSGPEVEDEMEQARRIQVTMPATREEIFREPYGSPRPDRRFNRDREESPTAIKNSDALDAWWNEWVRSRQQEEAAQ